MGRVPFITSVRNLLLSKKVNEVKVRCISAIPFKSFPFAQSEELELYIEDLTNLGLGVGRVVIDNGASWVIMVPYVLPGERVKVQISHNYKSYSEATLKQVLNPSEDRITPKCPYFISCGGCQYQHMNISSQRTCTNIYRHL